MRPRRPGRALWLSRPAGAPGQTTPSDVEKRFGVADEKTADGALVYRFDTTRRRGERMQTEAETDTFRFAGGKLAKVCRTRS